MTSLGSSSSRSSSAVKMRVPVSRGKDRRVRGSARWRTSVMPASPCCGALHNCRQMLTSKCSQVIGRAHDRIFTAFMREQAKLRATARPMFNRQSPPNQLCLGYRPASRLWCRLFAACGAD